jgi:hypothetical protein
MSVLLSSTSVRSLRYDRSGSSVGARATVIVMDKNGISEHCGESNPYPSAITLTELSRLITYLYSFTKCCGLFVRVPEYRSRHPGFDSRGYQILWEVVGLELGQLSLVSVTEQLLEWKSSSSRSRKPRLTAVGIHCADHATPFADLLRSLGRYS